ncbi:MAG: Capsule biosynthesis protein CapA, partial [Daejeonella sp.]|nr:Capsule biosynthesis protein CapA [Daejeonella sp.]
MYKIRYCLLNRSLSADPFSLLFLLLLLSACSPSSNNNKPAVVSTPLQDTIVAHPLSTSLHIVAVGDIMLGSAYKSVNDLPSDQATGSFKNVAAFLKTGDVIFGNLEGCFLDSGISKKCNEKKNCLAFRMPESYAQVFKDAGFNLLSLANNHSSDFGALGRNTTVNRLTELDIK